MDSGMDSSDREPPAQNAAPLITLTLRDGTALSVAPDVIHKGAESFALERLQDARQIVPDPQTVGLRVAGRGLVEFQPANSGDGALALEAIFRLRPDLRPIGFEPPAQAPAWWPPAGAAPLAPTWDAVWDSASGAPRGGLAGEWGAAPPPASPYRPPNAPRLPDFGFPPARVASPDGRLTPYPRDILGLIGASFRLFLGHWRAWLLLGLVTAGLPSVVSGALQMALYAAQGYNPWRAIDTTAASIVPTHLPRPGTLVVLILIGVAFLLVLILSSAWQASVLAAAARQALLGEPVDVRASLVAGMQRFVPVLLVTLAFAAGALVAMVAPLALLALVSAKLGPNPTTRRRARCLARRCSAA